MNSLVRTAVLSPPPLQLAKVKNWLRVPPNVTNDDDEITDLIEEARTHAELLTNCALVRSTFVQYLDHFPGHYRRGFSGSGAGYGYGMAGGYSGGHHYNREHRPHDEIKLKRPPLVSVQSLTYIGTDGRPYTLNPGQDFVVDVASQPGRIRPIPYGFWPLTLDTPAAVAIAFTAGYAPNIDSGSAQIAEPETVTAALNPSWQPNLATPQYSFLVDSAGNVQVQQNAGSPATGAGPDSPVWAVLGQTVVDGDCLWLNCGPIRGFWTPDTAFAGQNAWVVLDFNSNLQLLVVDELQSQPNPPEAEQMVGTSPLPWASTVGGLTTDNGIQAWRCLGQYSALGDNGLSTPNAPEQQAAITVDWTLPKVITRFMRAVIYHWYYNREPVTADNPRKVPLHFEDMLGEVTIHDFSPTP